MPTLKATGQVAIAEDISDVLSMITPHDTPFTSTIETGKLHNITHSWLTDALDTTGPIPVTEGADAVLATLIQPTQYTNYTQIFTKAFGLSSTTKWTKLHGRQEAAQQSLKAGQELKTQLERAVVQTGQVKVSGDTRQMSGVQALIDPASIIGTGATSTPSVNGPVLNEASLTKGLQRQFEQGGPTTTVMVTSTDSANLSNFVQTSGKYQRILNDKQDTVWNRVNYYVSPFGQTVKVVINRWLAPGDTLIYDPDQFRLMVGQPWLREDLAKTGLSDKQQVSGEFSLEHKNPVASTIIRRTSNT